MVCKCMFQLPVISALKSTKELSEYIHHVRVGLLEPQCGISGCLQIIIQENFTELLNER